jgi:hypothetical protein
VRFAPTGSRSDPNMALSWPRGSNRARRSDAVGGISEFTIAWKNVAAAALYQRQVRAVA